MNSMKNKFLSAFLVIVLIFSIVVSSITAAASDEDVDIGALICGASHSKDWKVSDGKIDRSNKDYARVSGANAVAGYSHKLGDETVKLRFSCKLDSKTAGQRLCCAPTARQRLYGMPGARTAC